VKDKAKKTKQKNSLPTKKKESLRINGQKQRLLHSAPVECFVPANYTIKLTIENNQKEIHFKTVTNNWQL